MSQPLLSQNVDFNETKQPELWGCLITFLIVNNVAIAGRLWGTWKSVANRSRVMAEDVLIVLSGIFVNVIIANLLVATHYGLGLHIYTVNARDPDYPSNLSRAFKHIWITMVLMSSFFTCIKMTLLFFYKRLFLVSNNSRLCMFWWANFVYVVLWFFGSTSFYILQCKPVQWYFIQYFQRFPHQPVPGGMTGQCDATTVLHVSLPLIFSLISDVSLLLLPIWAVSKLRLNKSKKCGLMAVFGIGLLACLLELARVVVLVIHTDDKDDPSYGVATFLILTAAEETTAVVCACLPIIVPQLIKKARSKDTHSYMYDTNGGSSRRRSAHGFKSVASFNHTWIVPKTIDTSTVDRIHNDDVPLTRVVIAGKNSTLKFNDQEGYGREGDIDKHPTHSDLPPRPDSMNQFDCQDVPGLPAPGNIHVRTDIEIQVGTAVQVRGQTS